ncbi:class I SAM-dependent methyltransferase [Nocardioides dongxiaopingii]|uniref:class I SAM-dependent methyltransferase n=1 Tax=Nocardioides sp. S-1144 TaxID=2582905 RepID=UPI0021CB485B|nr:class I SAM-dependent methyltransferase [Nocardioides sp. S-1144]
MSRWEEIARAAGGEDYGRWYAERFHQMTERGEDVHGEARFLARLVQPPASVLDAGCGTGRIAVRLAELGHDVVGLDVDPVMLAEARLSAPTLTWHLADLADFDLGRTFDVVLVAGNTLPLLEDGALGRACARLAAHLAPGGLLVCGLGLDEAHLPEGCPPTPYAAIRAATAAAGLREVGRWSSWARDPVEADPGYAVTVHTTDTGNTRRAVPRHDARDRRDG